MKQVRSLTDIIAENKTVAIICPVRFKEEFRQIETDLSLKGNIVLTPIDIKEGTNRKISKEESFETLMRLHRKKMDKADIVLAVIVDGYYGHGTYEEIGYSVVNNKELYILNIDSNKTLAEAIEPEAIEP